jgi:dihydrofolate reductase
MAKRNVVVFIACSIDGFIAGKEESLEFLSLVESPGEDYGYNEFIKTIDTVILGRKTYDKVLGFGVPFPHKERTCYVVTTTLLGKNEDTIFWNDSPQKLVRYLQEQDGADIFVDGGASVVNSLLKEGLIDRLTISFIPHLLGEGIRLFENGLPEQSMKLLGSTSFPSGLVQVTYEKKQ